MFKFLEPRELHVDVFFGRDGERKRIEIERPPRVIFVTDRLLRLWDPDAPMLEELGYEMYDRDISTMSSCWARRPWLWLLRARVWAVKTYWRVLNAGHLKLWHTPISRDGCEFRWRDMRLGSGALEMSRASAASWRRRAEKLQAEVDKLNVRLKADYVRGQKDGWDQHQLAVEDMVIEAFGIKKITDTRI